MPLKTSAPLKHTGTAECPMITVCKLCTPVGCRASLGSGVQFASDQHCANVCPYHQRLGRSCVRQHSCFAAPIARQFPTHARYTWHAPALIAASSVSLNLWLSSFGREHIIHSKSLQQQARSWHGGTLPRLLATGREEQASPGRVAVRA